MSAIRWPHIYAPNVHEEAPSLIRRSRPSPAADSAEPEIDDAALRKALGDKKRAKSKAPFADGACLGALTQTAAPSIGVVTLFSALALNYYIKNGPTLSEVAQSCLDIKCGYSTPPPPPATTRAQPARSTATTRATPAGSRAPSSVIRGANGKRHGRRPCSGAPKIAEKWTSRRFHCLSRGALGS